VIEPETDQVLWVIKQRGNNFMIQSKLDNVCIQPLEDNETNYYANKEEAYIWKFYDQNGNAIRDLTEDMETIYIKDTENNKWLQVSGGKNYKEGDTLVANENKEATFYQFFTIEYINVERKYCRISTTDEKNIKMFLGFPHKSEDAKLEDSAAADNTVILTKGETKDKMQKESKPKGVGTGERKDVHRGVVKTDIELTFDRTTHEIDKRLTEISQRRATMDSAKLKLDIQTLVYCLGDDLTEIKQLDIIIVL